MSDEGLRFRPRVAVVDANVALGHWHDQPSPAADAPALLAALDRHGIERAVVHHVYAQTKSTVEGNALLFEAIAGHEEAADSAVRGVADGCVAGAAARAATGRGCSAACGCTI